jgi:hypothetical protein
MYQSIGINFSSIYYRISQNSSGFIAYEKNARLFWGCIKYDFVTDQVLMLFAHIFYQIPTRTK